MLCCEIEPYFQKSVIAFAAILRPGGTARAASRGRAGVEERNPIGRLEKDCVHNDGDQSGEASRAEPATCVDFVPQAQVPLMPAL
jgi:hypothetical protein